mmetsp:Transcript_34753/g.75088  ORF Transcript_34753/g.75088 Transcript_34753/m.75088 type:complete len:319 (+) Transcript_34753:53-1009(+)
MASLTNNQLTLSTTAAQSDAAAAAAAADGPLSSFKMHGYRPSPNLSDDVTYMDIVMLITRSSMLRQGSMGCILVRPPPPPLRKTSMMAPTTTTVAVADGEETTNSSQTIQNNEEGDNDSRDDEQFLDRIIAAATNTSLFQPDDSDVHAEINAIGQVSKRLHYCSPTTTLTTATTANTNITPSMNNNTVCTTQGATAYITMPPCKRCFGALYASGIKRIVSRRQHSDILRKTASKVGIEMACMTQEELDQQQLRLNRLFANNSGNNENGNDGSENVSGEMNGVGEEGVEDADDIVLKRRRQRKEEKRARKMAKIAQMNN